MIEHRERRPAQREHRRERRDSRPPHRPTYSATIEQHEPDRASPRARDAGGSSAGSTPMSSAIGIVRPTVTTPHGLSPSAFTTTSAEHRDQHDHDAEHRDERGESGDRSDLLLRHLAERLPVRGGPTTQRITKSCTAPPSATPTMIQITPGRKPNCAASVGPTSGPGPGDRGEVVAEHDPPVRRHVVAAVVQPLGRRRAIRVEREDLRRDERDCRSGRR